MDIVRAVVNNARVFGAGIKCRHCKVYYGICMKSREDVSCLSFTAYGQQACGCNHSIVDVAMGTGEDHFERETGSR